MNNSNRTFRFGYYLKMAIRAQSKNKLFSIINLVGLTVGFFVTILIAQYVRFELSYDSFHPSYEDTYRVSFKRVENNQETMHAATTFLPVGTMLLDEYPEVRKQCRFYYPFTHGVINIDTESYSEEMPVFADESFFDVFSFVLIDGSKAALSNPNSIVISKELANKYFGNRNPIGEILQFSFEDGTTDLKVTGVMENPPPKSHLQLNMLISFSTLNQWPIFQDNAWSLPFYHTYIQLESGVEIEEFEARAKNLLAKFRPNDRGEGFQELFILQPLKNIHLDSDLQFELGQNGDRQAIQFMILVAILILLIIYLNYVNFVTAMASIRAKEVGIYKVMGANRFQLILRLLMESVAVNLLAFIIAASLSILFVNGIVEMTETYFEIPQDINFWLTLLGIVIVGAIVANLYPAIINSSFKPVNALRGHFSLNAKDGLLRKLLITAQLTITILMIGGVILVSNQTDYLLNKDPGFDANQLIVLNAPRNMQGEGFQSSISNFGESMTNYSNIHAFTTSGSVPGKVMGSGTIRRAEDESSEGTALHFNLVGYDFFETFGLTVKGGRAFSRSFQSDAMKVMINEAAASSLGYSSTEEAVGSKIVAGGREFEILGVVSNYHHSSLKISFEPIVFVLSPRRMVYLTLRMDKNQLEQSLKIIEEEMIQRFPGHPFEYFFLEDVFEREFKNEFRYAGLLKNFSILAVILASLGLYGLSIFLINQRSKELGIRKLLGASSLSFARLLSSFFFIPTIVGVLLACTMLYYFGDRWLSTFAFRVSWDKLVFIIPIGIVLAMTALTIFQLIRRSSRIEPTKLLRDE